MVYTPTVAGNDQVAIRLNGNHIGGSPYTSTVVAAGASTIVINDGNNQTGTVNSVLPADPSVKVTDPNGNPVAGIAVTFAVTSGGGSITGANQVTNAAGVARVGSWQLGTAAGTNTLTATAPGLTGSPVTITATGTPAGVSASQSSLNLSASDITASNGASAVTVTVTARDAFGNLVSGVSVTLSATGSGNSISQPGLTDGSGVATGTVSSTTAGSKTVSAVVDGVSITQTQVVTVSPAAADAASTTATVPSGSAGNPANISIQAKDQFGNNVTVGGATVEVTVSGSNTAGPIVATDNGDGTYSASYTPTVSGPDQVDITLNGTPISGSPFGTTVATGSASSILQFAGDNQTGPIGTTLAIVPTVLVTDAGGNPIPGIQVSFAVSGGGGSTSAPSGTTGGDGQVGVAWTLGPTAGTQTLSATATGLTGSPVLFSATATPGNPTVVIQSHTPDPSDIGQTVDVSYSVTSSIGAPTGTVTVSDGVDTCVGTVAAGTCPLTLTTAGTRMLTASYAGDASFSAAVSAGVNHSVNPAGTTTAIDGHTPDPSVVGQGITVNVSVASAGGSPAGTVTVSDGTDSCDVTLSNGLGSCVLTPTTSGSKALTAAYAGTASFLTSLSAGVAHQVDPFGPVDVAQTLATVPDGQSGSVTVITIVTRDQFGNLVTVGGATVVVDVTGANTASASVSDNGDGTYTATYTPSTPGADMVTIVINGNPLPGSPISSTVL